MDFRLISEGKTGKTAEVVVNRNGQRFTRHLRITAGKWTGWNLGHTRIVEYDMRAGKAPDFDKPDPEEKKPARKPRRKDSKSE